MLMEKLFSPFPVSLIRLLLVFIWVLNEKIQFTLSMNNGHMVLFQKAEDVIKFPQNGLPLLEWDFCAKKSNRNIDLVLQCRFCFKTSQDFMWFSLLFWNEFVCKLMVPFPPLLPWQRCRAGMQPGTIPWPRRWPRIRRNSCRRSTH